MPAIKDSVFGPMQPKVDPELLPQKIARLAQNLKHTSGAMEPWKLPAAVAGASMPGLSPIRTIYRYGKDVASKLNYWFQFEVDVNIVRGPVNSDTEERTYWTDGEYPKKTKSDLAGLIAGQAILPTSLRMGVPPPGWSGLNTPLTFTPMATVSGTALDPTSTPITSAYVWTYRTTWGEESAPGAVSNIVVWRTGQTVTVTAPGVLSGAYGSINKAVLYRSNSGTSRTSYQEAASINVALSSHADTKLPADLGEVCSTWDWMPPPDAMIGLTDMGNGMLAGYSGNTVHFCEPGYPYAWPEKYDIVLSAPITGMAHFDQTLVVGTTDGVVRISGLDPSNMSESPKGSQAVVSKRSMVSMRGGVVYSSPDGVEFEGPAGHESVSESVISREDWQTYNPASIEAYTIDGRYYAFYDNGTTRGCLIFSFGDDRGFVRCDQHITAGFNERRLDSLFVVTRVGGTNTLMEWGTGSNMTVTWRSRDYRFDAGVCMSRAMVKASGYPLVFKLYADGALKYTYSVPDGLPFPLPVGRDNVISYEIESANKVTRVGVATSVKELGELNG